MHGYLLAGIHLFTRTRRPHSTANSPTCQPPGTIQYNLQVQYNTTSRYNTIQPLGAIQYNLQVQYNTTFRYNTIQPPGTIQYNLQVQYNTTSRYNTLPIVVSNMRPEKQLRIFKKL